MTTTFAGACLPPCGAITRPQRQRRVTRGSNVPTPAAWLALVVEGWQGSKSLVWSSYQAFVGCRYSEVVAFRQKLLLWPTLIEGVHELGTRGVTPAAMLKIVELALSEHRLSAGEAAELEEAILRHVDREGRWRA